MRDLIKMIVVLTVICAVSGAALALVRQVTREPIELAKLKNVKEPAVKAVLSGYTNDPIVDRISIPMGKDKRDRPVFLTVFPAKKDGKTYEVAFESSDSGYHGEIDVMVGINVEKKDITGISIVGHSETPGLGARIIEPSFTDSFKDKPLDTELTKDSIAALSGATLSTNGVVKAVNKARATFEEHKDQMLK
ncbi:MAG: RnfABCDGE type electron transport complex subunit G [Deltaproteobacteria bacterium]|nr:RnfABCDGE type electron transport complex subunit G [Deltaproteobacteria bacterium]